VSSIALPQPEANGRPDIAHAILGRQLNALRELAGISPEAASACLRCDKSKISRIEGGKVTVKDDDLNQLLDFYGIPDKEERAAFLGFNARLNEPKWWRPYGHALPSWFCSYLVFESAATQILTYERHFIPGLLQTRAYAEAIIRCRYTDEGQIRRLVDIRMHRQQVVLKKRTKSNEIRVLWALIDKAALDDVLNEPGIMREQIAFLIQALHELNVQIQVVERGALAARSNSFSILRLRGRRLSQVVYLEQFDSAQFFDHPTSLEPYWQAFLEIASVAKKPAEAQEFLVQTLANLGS
jgi:transcriptional regulator with XRE-family HTH domain